LGLLHRDIKPANCFENNGIYKLGDFGAIVEADYTNKKLMKL
jgi:serine/threonine protein kinase